LSYHHIAPHLAEPFTSYLHRDFALYLK